MGRAGPNVLVYSPSMHSSVCAHPQRHVAVKREAMRGGDRGGVVALKKATSFFTATHANRFSKPTSSCSPGLVRCVANSAPPPVSAAMDDAAAGLQQKRALRSQIRKALKAFPPDQRAQEDVAIQNNVLSSSWFKSSKGLCAYISSEALREVDTSKIVAEVLKNSDAGKRRLYVPRVEDKNSNMRMLRISTIEDLVANSMNILEPSPIDADQREREDVLLASQPVDLLVLPGLAFDRQGRRLGRGGGYYDVFLHRYEELVNLKKWKQPLRVALAYSVQVLDDNLIPMTATDVPVDALVTVDGIIPISPGALESL